VDVAAPDRARAFSEKIDASAARHQTKFGLAKSIFPLRSFAPVSFASASFASVSFASVLPFVARVQAASGLLLLRTRPLPGRLHHASRPMSIRNVSVSGEPDSWRKYFFSCDCRFGCGRPQPHRSRRRTAGASFGTRCRVREQR
jgi:hypothetical protein